ncbi:MAG: anti-sigma factor [Thermoleophilia bacterium]
MTREHDAVRDLVAVVALGAADPAETARVEAHAAECAVCREELAALRGGADVLAVAVPQHEPRPELRASLMETVRREAAERSAAAEGPEPQRPAPSRRRWWDAPARLRPVLAVAAALAALLVGWGVATQFSGDDGPAATTVAVAGTPDAPAIEGRVVYVPDEGTAVMELSNLPPLAVGDAYQLWVLRDGEPPRSAGLMEASGPAQARVAATGLEGAQGLAVTAQPRTSRMVPEGPILVQAPLEAA